MASIRAGHLVCFARHHVVRENCASRRSLDDGCLRTDTGALRLLSCVAGVSAVSPQQPFGDLHGVQGRTLAQLVAHHPEREAGIEHAAWTHAAHRDLVAPGHG
jgi:hypothetical protein